MSKLLAPQQNHQTRQHQTLFSPMSSPKYCSKALRLQPGPVANFSISANSWLPRWIVVAADATPLVFMAMMLNVRTRGSGTKGVAHK